jgi:hypothetical protein
MGNQNPYMRSVMCIAYCLHDWQTIFIILFSSFWTVDREKNKIFVPTYHRFLTATIPSQTSKRHLSACNIWTCSRRFSRNLTPRAPKKYFNSSCVLFILIILVSNKIDTYLTSLWRHARYLFSVFRGILPLIFRRFSKKLSTSVVVHQTIFTRLLSGVYFICMLYNCYVPTYHRFLRKILLLKHQNVIWALVIFEHFPVVFQEI